MAFTDSLSISPPAVWRVDPSQLLLPLPSLRLVLAVLPPEGLPFRAPLSHYCKTYSPYTHPTSHIRVGTCIAAGTRQRASAQASLLARAALLLTWPRGERSVVCVHDLG